MKTKLMLALTGFLLTMGTIAQESSYSLLQAQDYAVANSYNVKSASLEIEKSKKILLENIATGLPQVNTTGNWTNNLDRQVFVLDQGNGPVPIRVGTKYTGSAIIAGEQLIFDGSYIVAILAADVLKENSINAHEKTQIDIREQVAKSYHLVLVSEKTLEIINDNLVYVEKNFEESKRMFEVGFMEEQDVNQLELIVSNLKNNRDYAEKQIAIAKMLLKFHMGLDVDKDIRLTDEVETLMLFSQEGGTLLTESFNLENHIDYRTLLTQERGQDLNLKNERVSLLPKLKFNYLYQESFFSEESGLYSNGQNVGNQYIALNLSLPIFTGGKRIARIQQAKIEVDQLAISKMQLTDNLKVQFETAKAEYDYALNSYFTQVRNVEISKKIRDVASRKLAEGIGTSLDYTTTENQYQDALSSAINAANNVLDKKVQLEKILGKYNTVQ